MSSRRVGKNKDGELDDETLLEIDGAANVDKSNSGASPLVKSFLDLTQTVRGIVNEIVETTVGDSEYNADKVGQTADKVTTTIIEKIKAHTQQFKVLVNVIILEKKNSGFHMFTTCYWEKNSDGSVIVRWENNTLHCIVSVYGISMA